MSLSSSPTGERSSTWRHRRMTTGAPATATDDRTDFEDESLDMDARRDDLTLQGAIGLPTMNRPTAAGIFLFVNGRPVRDARFLAR